MDKALMKFKEDLLKTGLFKSRPRAGEYTLKECPYCGDMKNHVYVKIDLGNDSPVVFNCFKCPAGGILTQDFLNRMNIDNIRVPKYNGSKQIKVDSTVSTKIPDINVNVNDNIEGVCKYIQSRVGVYPTLTELQMFGYVGDPYKYAETYLGKDNIWVINNERYWFRMTNGNIIGRYYNDETDHRWLKYRTDKVRTAGLYNIRVPFDLYDEINVIIAEGVMDVVGLYYNYKEFKNCIYVGVMGKDYIKGVKYVLNKGIFGTSVNIRIFKDPNVDVKDIYIDNNLRKLFNKVEVYGNMNDKDYGILPEELDIHKVHVNKIRKESV